MDKTNSPLQLVDKNDIAIFEICNKWADGQNFSPSSVFTLRAKIALGMRGKNDSTFVFGNKCFTICLIDKGEQKIYSKGAKRHRSISLFLIQHTKLQRYVGSFTLSRFGFDFCAV